MIIRAAANDGEATEQLLGRYRARLRRMIAIRFDHRISHRLDPSDVVQDVMIKAMHGLPEYARDRPIAFYPWLRQLAWDQLVQAFRRNVLAKRRSVQRELDLHEPIGIPFSGHSAVELANVLLDGQLGPFQNLEEKETRQQLQQALAEIQESYREVLIMRYMESLSIREIAECLQISESAVKMRNLRALKQLGKLLNDIGLDDG